MAVQDLPPGLRDLLQEGPDLVRIAAATITGLRQDEMRSLGEASYHRRECDPVVCDRRHVRHQSSSAASDRAHPGTAPGAGAVWSKDASGHCIPRADSPSLIRT